MSFRKETTRQRVSVKSRMTGDCHVRFCEGLGVQFPRPTRLNLMLLLRKTTGYLGVGPTPSARNKQEHGRNEKRKDVEGRHGHPWEQTKYWPDWWRSAVAD